jgi:hypothetical protein
VGKEKEAANIELKLHELEFANSIRGFFWSLEIVLIQAK